MRKLSTSVFLLRERAGDRPTGNGSASGAKAEEALEEKRNHRVGVANLRLPAVNDVAGFKRWERDKRGRPGNRST